MEEKVEEEGGSNLDEIINCPLFTLMFATLIKKVAGSQKKV